MQMVCIISCNNPVQAAPRRLNSSNRASDPAQSQQRERSGCCRQQRLRQSSALDPPFTLAPGLGGASTQLWEMLWGAGAFAAGGG